MDAGVSPPRACKGDRAFQENLECPLKLARDGLDVSLLLLKGEPGITRPVICNLKNENVARVRRVAGWRNLLQVNHKETPLSNGKKKGPRGPFFQTHQLGREKPTRPSQPSLQPQRLPQQEPPQQRPPRQAPQRLPRQAGRQESQQPQPPWRPYPWERKAR